MVLLASTTHCSAQAQEEYEAPIDSTVQSEFAVDAAEAENESGNEAMNIDLQDQLNQAKKNEKVIPQRSMQDSTWMRMAADKNFKYDSLKEKKVKPEEIKIEEPQTGSQSRFRLSNSAGVVILYIMLALVVIMLLYAFFGKQYFNKKDKVIITSEPNYENVEEFTEWDLALKNALSENNFRLATRILFLQTLQSLNEKNIITYKQETLNTTYLQKMYQTSYYKPFAALVRYFEYTWYGKYDIGQKEFIQIQQQFLEFKQSIAV
jgi:flagellar basal body-associated protein FliL